MSDERKKSPVSAFGKKDSPSAGPGKKAGDFYDYSKDSSLADIFLLLKKSSWTQAEALCDEFISKNPQCAEAYFGKLMCEYHLRTKEDFSQLDEPFDSSENYIKILQIGREELIRPLKKYLLEIYEGIYCDAISMMDKASTEYDFFQAAQLFKTIPNYKDSSACAQQCEYRSEAIHNDTIYNRAVDRLRYADTWAPNDTTIQAYEASVAELKTIADWKDSQQKLAIYQAKLYDIKVQADKNRDIREKAKTKRKKSKHKKLIIISLISLAVLIPGIILSVAFLVPETHSHTLVFNITDKNCEDMYVRLSEFKGFKPIDKLLQHFTWQPSSRINFSGNALFSTKMEFHYNTSHNLIEGTADSFYAFGKNKEDIKWKSLDVDTQFEYIYNDSGLLVEERTKTDGSVAVTKYQYDQEGNCIEEEYTDAKGKTSTTIHRYNEDNTRIKSVSTDKDHKESVHTYEYDSHGNIKKEVITDHKGKTQAIEYTRDQNGNCLKQTVVNKNGKRTDIANYQDYEMYYFGKQPEKN